MRYTKQLRDGTIIEVVNEYEQFFGKDRYNWIEYHPFMIRFEKNIMMGELEIEIYILGIGFRVATIYNRKAYDKKMRQFKKMIKEGNFVKWKE